MKTTTTLNQVTVNTALELGKGEFQLVEETGKYIYSIAAGAGATVSTNYITYPDKVSFSMDQVNGVPVIRAFGTGNILVAKYSETKNAWRIWCLPESELANEGVYPVMLATLHTHSYGTEYAFDQSGHWHLCDCGSTSEQESHSFQMDEALGYGVCACGADQKPHTCESADGKWYASGETHYQLCGKCGDVINTEDHTYNIFTGIRLFCPKIALSHGCTRIAWLHNNRVYRMADERVDYNPPSRTVCVTALPGPRPFCPLCGLFPR